MVAAAVLTLLNLAPAPQTPTWEEILGNMHRDVRTLKGVHEEWVLDGGSEEDGKVKASYLRWFDGPRVRQEISIEGSPLLALASDGARMWMAVPSKGFYLWKSGPEDPTKRKWEGLSEEESATPSFNIGMQDAYDLSIKFVPRPTVTKVEEVADERLVYAVLKTEDRQMDIVMRFEKAKWLLKEIDGKSTGGTTISFKRLKADRDQTLDSKLFELDTKIVSGLRELSPSEAEDFMKGLNGGGSAW